MLERPGVLGYCGPTMRLLAITALLAASCGPQEPTPWCVTQWLDWRISGDEPVRCDDFERAQRAIVDAFIPLQNTDARFASTEKALKAVRIEVRPERVWDCEASGWCLAGRTYCGERRMEINNASPLCNGSLAHEMAHVVQNCWPDLLKEYPAQYASDSTYNWGHEGWESQGIFAAIDAANRRMSDEQ